MTVQKLINQYQEKINKENLVIEKIISKVGEVRKDNTLDVEDLREKMLNAQRDRQLYFQFTKDLEYLLP